eukprot:TRINITY_DN439_c0_g1_i1.p1 TRINITY_DN439_c0_g1~~TRINITY_DN439_c0_g1_i1.p1  ORF type:complete len:116 (-),score=37.61 TRINITY_DN439_c0_g1_i1:211-558(-)
MSLGPELTVEEFTRELAKYQKVREKYFQKTPFTSLSTDPEEPPEETSKNADLLDDALDQAMDDILTEALDDQELSDSTKTTTTSDQSTHTKGFDLDEDDLLDSVLDELENFRSDP